LPGRPTPLYVLVHLIGVRERVPAGTEVWTVDSQDERRIE
jgi:hypothetical protein